MTGTSPGARLLSLSPHEKKADPHPQYWNDTRGMQKVHDLVVGDADENLNTLAKLANALKNISGIPLGVIVPIGVNFPVPPGFVNVSYSQPSYHPVAGLPAEFVAGYYCGDDKNATAAFGFRCDNLDGTSRNTSGAYIALEPASNQFYRVMDDTGERDPFMLHEDKIKEHNHATPVGNSNDPQPWGRDIIAYPNMLSGTSTANYPGSFSSPTGGDETVPKHIDKKFIMKVYDGAASDPALVDWQKYLDLLIEYSAIKLDRSEAFGFDQDLVNVTAALNPPQTWRQNTSGKTCFLIWSFSGRTNGGSEVNIGKTQTDYNTVFSSGISGGLGPSTITLPIPDGYWYRGNDPAATTASALVMGDLIP